MTAAPAALAAQIRHFIIHAHVATFAYAAVERLVNWYLARFPEAPEAEPYRLLTITFESLDGPRRSPVNVNIERLYDTSKPPREITRFDVAKSPDTLDFK